MSLPEGTSPSQTGAFKTDRIRRHVPSNEEAARVALVVEAARRAVDQTAMIYPAGGLDELEEALDALDS